MNDFSIDLLARAQIEKLLRESDYGDPVPSLGESAAVSDSAFANYRDALKRDGAKGRSLEDIASDDLANASSSLNYELVVNVFERSLYEDTPTPVVDGIELAILDVLRAALRGYTLTYVAERFCLRGQSGLVRNLRDVVQVQG